MRCIIALECAVPRVVETSCPLAPSNADVELQNGALVRSGYLVSELLR